jgi:hypothetical protein
MAISASEVRASSRTRRQRYIDGKTARRKVPRSAHAKWAPAKNRADPLETLDGAGRGRLRRLVPVWYGPMSLSPFAFYRPRSGSAPLSCPDRVRARYPLMWRPAAHR